MSGLALPARGLTPRIVATRARPAISGGRKVFWVVLAAILSQLTISANLLQYAGIPYNTTGGLPLVKFHPATYLAALAAVLQIRLSRPVMPRLVAQLARSPHFPLAAAVMLVCAAYALASTGISGTAVYIESYVSAALLGFVLEQRPAAELRHIAYAMLAVLTMNALLCIGETGMQRLLVPVLLTDPDGYVTELASLDSEFRGLALYEHPLGGAMITMMGVFLCLATDLRPTIKACALAPLLVSLIAFGGRTAMLVTYAALAALALRAMIVRLVQRRMNGGMLAAVTAALILVPCVLAFILFETSLGSRISGKFYVDDSATVRVVQWLILGRMDMQDWLFGMASVRLNQVMLQIGLSPPYNDIENFWLLVFVSLGITGFALWLSGLAVLLRRLWLAPGLYPRLILLSVLAVASGSNSLGRKSNILFVCVAAIMSAAAFTKTQPEAA